MRYLVCKTSVFALLAALGSGALGCGDSGSDDSVATPDGDERDGGNSNTSTIVYPDALCDNTGCVANTEEPGHCDPNASDTELADCNAWRINGSFSLSAIKIDASAKRGRPPAPRHTDDEACPPNSITPKGKADGEHCCERVSEQSSMPAFMLSGISLRDPPVFGLSTVSNTNKTAIEEDRYNWIMQLSSDQPGPVMITSGLGLQNEDGSFAFAEGPFELGGEMWNTKGEWDPHLVPGVLGADGRLSYESQYRPQGRLFQLPLWGTGYEFTMMVLSMDGIEMTIKLSDDKLCGGYLTGHKTFDSIGMIKSYLPLEPLRDVVLHFKKGDSGTGLCPLTAGVEPADCKKPVAEWGK